MFTGVNWLRYHCHIDALNSALMYPLSVMSHNIIPFYNNHIVFPITKPILAYSGGIARH